MRRIVVPILAASLIFAGCVGGSNGFRATQKLYKWNKSFTGNKFVQAAVFFVLSAIPVYEFTAGIIDALILNSIDFWTGSNPLAHHEVKLEDGRLAVLDRNEDGSVTVRIGDETLTMVDQGDQMAIYGAQGELVSIAVQTADGGLSIVNSGGTRVISGDAVQSVAANFGTGLRSLVVDQATCSR